MSEWECVTVPGSTVPHPSPAMAFHVPGVCTGFLSCAETMPALRIYYHLVFNVPGEGSGSTAALTRINRLLNLNERTNEI